MQEREHLIDGDVAYHDVDRTVRTQQQAVKRDKVGARHRGQPITQPQGEVIVGVRTVKRLKEMLESELEAIFLERLEVTQLVRPFALHFGVGKRRFGQDLEIEFQSLRTRLLEKACPELQGITVAAGTEGCPQAVEIALDLCRTA